MGPRLRTRCVRNWTGHTTEPWYRFPTRINGSIMNWRPPRISGQPGSWSGRRILCCMSVCWKAVTRRLYWPWPARSEFHLRHLRWSRIRDALKAASMLINNLHYFEKINAPVVFGNNYLTGWFSACYFFIIHSTQLYFSYLSMWSQWNPFH